MESPSEPRGMDADFLGLLVCPETHQPLRAATTEELAKVQLAAALVRGDGRVAYPVCDGIPVLLADAAIQIE